MRKILADEVKKEIFDNENSAVPFRRFVMTWLPLLGVN